MRLDTFQRGAHNLFKIIIREGISMIKIIILKTLSRYKQTFRYPGNVISNIIHVDMNNKINNVSELNWIIKRLLKREGPNMYKLDFIKLQQIPHYCLDVKHGLRKKNIKMKYKRGSEFQQMKFVRLLVGCSSKDHIWNSINI